MVRADPCADSDQAAAEASAETRAHPAFAKSEVSVEHALRRATELLLEV
jgi:hypothetical protein